MQISRQTLKCFSLCLGLVFFVACGSGGGGSSTKSWESGGTDVTIDDIVNGSGSSSNLASTGKATTSTDASFYYGRFLLIGSDSNLYSGTIRFKLNKQSDSFAYFSDFSLDHFSRADTISTNTALVTPRTDLSVTAAFSSTTNTMTITDATTRFVAFDVAFGNATAFAPLSITGIFDAGIIFTKDFTSCAGGDDRSFIFIAQKVDSQPDVEADDTLGNWKSINFTVNSSGSITAQSTAELTVEGTGGLGGDSRGFTGTNSASGDFAGEMILNDATSAAFFFGYGSTTTSTTATGTHGAFISSADKSIVIGYDNSSDFYFAVERR